jgi:hypothetical protein
MIPAVTVVLDTLPLTPNGKIDRGALPVPEARPEIGVYVEPRTPIEGTLVSIWRELLSLDRVGVEDNFFDLGGHSLLATRVVARVRELLAVELGVRELFDSPRLDGLAKRIGELRWVEQNRRALLVEADAGAMVEEGRV